jgi:hypothetical protein
MFRIAMCHEKEHEIAKAVILAVKSVIDSKGISMTDQEIVYLEEEIIQKMREILKENNNV